MTLQFLFVKQASVRNRFVKTKIMEVLDCQQVTVPKQLTTVKLQLLFEAFDVIIEVTVKIAIFSVVIEG